MKYTPIKLIALDSEFRALMVDIQPQFKELSLVYKNKDHRIKWCTKTLAINQKLINLN